MTLTLPYLEIGALSIPKRRREGQLSFEEETGEQFLISFTSLRIVHEPLCWDGEADGSSGDTAPAWRWLLGVQTTEKGSPLPGQ